MENEQAPIIVGLDLSMNHWALVLMDYKTGEIINWFFGDPRKKFQKDYKEKHFLMPNKDKKNGETNENFELRRISELVKVMMVLLIDPVKSSGTTYFGGEKPEDWSSAYYINIEGYSFGSLSRSTFQMGEVGGMVKYLLWSYDWNIRITDPDSVKMWAIKGNAKKKAIAQEALSSGFDIPMDLFDIEKNGEWSGVGTDLADAYWLADLLRTELMLRRGDMGLSSLTEQKLKVVNRVTKANPENLLVREFIRRK